MILRQPLFIITGRRCTFDRRKLLFTYLLAHLSDLHPWQLLLLPFIFVRFLAVFFLRFRLRFRIVVISHHTISDYFSYIRTNLALLFILTSLIYQLFLDLCQIYFLAFFLLLHFAIIGWFQYRFFILLLFLLLFVLDSVHFLKLDQRVDINIFQTARHSLSSIIVAVCIDLFTVNSLIIA